MPPITSDGSLWAGRMRLVRIMRVVLLILSMAWVQFVAVVGSVAVSGGDYDATGA